MEKGNAAHKTSSTANQASSANTRSTKKPFSRKVKNLVLCGIIQEDSSRLALPARPRTTSRTRMTGNNANQAGWHTIDGPMFQCRVPVRYTDLALIGQGAFGVVVRAKDVELGKTVAIKKMVRAFDTELHAQRTYRELKLLTHLNHPDAQVVQLFNVFTPDTNLNEFRNLYFVFNDAGRNLDEFIGRGIPFTEQHIQSIIYSMLRGLKFMHSAGVIHRDLKPQNIGIDQKSNVTILDFGLARVASAGVQTGYVSTRWWRAPEIYTSWERYTEKLDIWSVGCIMAELILLRTIFRGRDHIDQLNQIFDVLGTPDPKIVNEICTPDIRTYLQGLIPRPKQDFAHLFGFNYGAGSETPISGVSPTGVKLLERLLAFDHRIRPTAAEALAHPFFESLHDPNDEPTGELMVDEYADANFSIAKWKSLIWKMIEDFTPPAWINNQSDDEA